MIGPAFCATPIPESCQRCSNNKHPKHLRHSERPHPKFYPDLTSCDCGCPEIAAEITPCCYYYYTLWGDDLDLRTTTIITGHGRVINNYWATGGKRAPFAICQFVYLYFHTLTTIHAELSRHSSRKSYYRNH
jgi:hypothetical protein